MIEWNRNSPKMVRALTRRTGRKGVEQMFARLLKQWDKEAFANQLLLSRKDSIKTVCALLVAVLVSEALYLMNLDAQNTIMVYILCILIISRITEGYVYGVIGSVICVFAYDYFITDPRLKFSMIKPEYPITFTIMLVVAFVTSTLTMRIKAQAAVAVERERRTELLYELNIKYQATKGLDGIISLTLGHIVEAIKRSCVFYMDDPAIDGNGHLLKAQWEADASYMLNETARHVASWVYNNHEQAGVGTLRFSDAEAYYLPVEARGKVLGVLGVSCAQGKLPNRSAMVTLRMLASQAALAIERQQMEEESQRVLIASEKEKMRSNLLRAISHDLRTPLTGILGASSAILENYDIFDKMTCLKLIGDIREDSQWLIRMVENLLSVTRIQEETMKVIKTPEAAEEIVIEAAGRIKKRFPDREILIAIPDELLLVPMDGTLILQVLINLLENAAKYSIPDEPIHLSLEKRNNDAVFEVSDNGPLKVREVCSQEEREEKSPVSDSVRGMGIGLSICRSIVNAHEGVLDSGLNGHGGMVVSFSLPLS